MKIELSYSTTEQLIAKRARALAAGNLKEAQRLKIEVLKRRFVIEDKPEGTTWYRDNA